MKNKCVRCLHEWMPRTETKVLSCPKCKSYFWDKPSADKADLSKNGQMPQKMK